MLYTKKRQISEIMSSRGGLHLSIYILRSQCKDATRAALDRALAEATKILSKTLTPSEVEIFLKPIKNLDCIHQSFTGNVGIFRKQNSLRIINLPVPVQNLCVVSSTFHVKPLIQWLQSFPDFLVASFGRWSLRLFHGSEQKSRIVDLFPIRDLLVAENSEDTEKRNSMLDEASKWLDTQLSLYHEDLRYTPIFITGPAKWAFHLGKRLKSPVNSIHVINTKGIVHDSLHSIESIRKLVPHRMKDKFEKDLGTYVDAFEKKEAVNNLDKIAKAAAAGRIRSLMVASDIQIFGTFDAITGHLSLNNTQRDSEDECVFDDIAQTVLEKGGFVHVVDRFDIPNADLAMAIVDLGPSKTLRRYNLGRKLPIPA